MEEISVRLPLQKQYILPIRLLVGGLCSVAGFSVDDTEDIKVALCEAVLILLTGGYASCEIVLRCENGIYAEITGIGEALSGNINEFAFTLIKELVDSLEVTSKGGRINALTLKKAVC